MLSHRSDVNLLLRVMALLVELVYKGCLDHFRLLPRRCSGRTQHGPSTSIRDAGTVVLNCSIVCTLGFHFWAALRRRRHDCRSRRCHLHGLRLRVLSRRRSCRRREDWYMARRPIARIPRKGASREPFCNSAHGSQVWTAAVKLVRVKLGNAVYMW